jgi:hypothetical protein
MRSRRNTSEFSVAARTPQWPSIEETMSGFLATRQEAEQMAALARVWEQKLR